MKTLFFIIGIFILSLLFEIIIGLRVSLIIISILVFILTTSFLIKKTFYSKSLTLENTRFYSTSYKNNTLFKSKKKILAMIIGYTLSVLLLYNGLFGYTSNIELILLVLTIIIFSILICDY